MSAIEVRFDTYEEAYAEHTRAKEEGARVGPIQYNVRTAECLFMHMGWQEGRHVDQ